MNIYKELRKQVSRDDVDNVQFDSDWREKLKNYHQDFKGEYDKNFAFLLYKLKLKKLKKRDSRKKYLIFFDGISGSGKTTIAEIVNSMLKDSVVLSGSKIVRLLELYERKNKIKNERIARRYGFSPPDPWYSAYPYRDDIIKYCLGLGHNVILESNIRTKKDRLGFYKLAKEYGAKTVVIQIYVPFDICCKRIWERDYKTDPKWTLEKVRKWYGRFVFQGQDIDRDEQKMYKVIDIDGMQDLEKIKRFLEREFHRFLPKVL